MARVAMGSETSGSSSWSLDKRRDPPSQRGDLSTTRRRGRATKPLPPAAPAAAPSRTFFDLTG